MKIDNNLIDKNVLNELGRRLREQRLELKVTQADLSEKAGVGKHTLERLESGESTQLSNFIRILRALDLLENINIAIPEVTIKPVEYIKHKEKPRQRARKIDKTGKSAKEWTWGDEK